MQALQHAPRGKGWCLVSVELEVEVAGITFLVEVEPGKPARLAGRPEDCEPAEPREWHVTAAWNEEAEFQSVVVDALEGQFEQEIHDAVQEAELE